jgi:hypothetical protein
VFADPIAMPPLYNTKTSFSQAAAVTNLFAPNIAKRLEQGGFPPIATLQH